MFFEILGFVTFVIYAAKAIIWLGGGEWNISDEIKG